MLTFTEEKVNIGDVSTHFYTAGEGEPLLWLHGMDGITSILPMFEELAKQYKVYLVDHPGFGLSERKEDRFCDFEDYNYFYRDFLDHFSLEKVHVVGHSIGGRMAVEFAISHPHRVDKLVLIAPSGLLVDGVKRSDIFIVQPEDRPSYFFHSSKYINEAKNYDKNDTEKSMEVKNLTSTVRLTWERDYNRKFPAQFRYITAPTCIIWGENDKMYPVQHAEVYERNIHTATLHVLENCGHMPHIEQSEKCTAIIEQFLRN